MAPNCESQVNVGTPNSTTVPYASFYNTFTLGGAPLGGSVTIWADDTADVYLNGVTIFKQTNFANSTCNTAAITCRSGAGTLFDLTANLKKGQNVLQFDVYQTGGGPFGLMYTGSVSAVPEPGTYALMGAALAGVIGIARRRRAA